MISDPRQAWRYIQMLFLGALLCFGLGLVVLSFVYPDRFTWHFTLGGCGLLAVAGLWMYLDYKWKQHVERHGRKRWSETARRRIRLVVMILDMLVVSGLLVLSLAFTCVAFLPRSHDRTDVAFVEGRIADIAVSTGKSRNLFVVLERDDNRYGIPLHFLADEQRRALIAMGKGKADVKLLVPQSDIGATNRKYVAIHGIYADRPVLSYEQYESVRRKNAMMLKLATPPCAAFMVFAVVKKIKLWRQGRTSALS